MLPSGKSRPHFFLHCSQKNCTNRSNTCSSISAPLRSNLTSSAAVSLNPASAARRGRHLKPSSSAYLQKVNDLEIILPGQINSIPLTAEQRQTVLYLLENAEIASFDKIRKALKLEKKIGFNLQRGGETKLKGNLTNTHMAAVFAERWPAMSDADKMQVVEDWRTIPEDDSLIRRAIEYWKLDETGARGG